VNARHLKYVGGTDNVHLHDRIRHITRYHWPGKRTAVDDGIDAAYSDRMQTMDVSKVAGCDLDSFLSNRGEAIQCQHRSALLSQSPYHLSTYQPCRSGDKYRFGYVTIEIHARSSA